MAFMYTCAFDIVEANSLYGLGTLTMDNGGAAGTPIVLTLGSITSTSVDGDDATATIFWVWDEGDFSCRDSSRYAQTKFAHYSAATWAKAVDSALKAAALAAGWNVANVPFCTFSTTSAVYAFGTGGGSASDTSLAWSTANGRKLFGFTADSASAAVHTGTATPLFVIRPTLSAPSDPRVLFEPGGVASRAVADDARGFGLDRYVAPLHRDWTQEHETLAKTMRLEASSTHPWTYQAQREHCRGRFPFIVGDGEWGEDESEPLVFSFRRDGMAWHAESHTPGNFAQLRIPYRCVQEGVLIEAQ